MMIWSKNVANKFMRKYIVYRINRVGGGTGGTGIWSSCISTTIVCRKKIYKARCHTAGPKI